MAELSGPLMEMIKRIMLILLSELGFIGFRGYCDSIILYWGNLINLVTPNSDIFHKRILLAKNNSTIIF